MGGVHATSVHASAAGRPSKVSIQGSIQGRPSKVSALHYNTDDSVLIQLSGTKRFTLVSPHSHSHAHARHQAIHARVSAPAARTPCVPG
jgi:hypothetical protein